MVLWPGSTTYVPQEQFWTITLLNLYSVASHVYPLTAPFETMSTNSTLWKKKTKAENERGLTVFDTDILNTSAEITGCPPGKIGGHRSYTHHRGVKALILFIRRLVDKFV